MKNMKKIFYEEYEKYNYEEYEKYNIYLKKPRRIRINKTKYTHMTFDDIYTRGGLWDKK